MYQNRLVAVVGEGDALTAGPLDPGLLPVSVIPGGEVTTPVAGHPVLRVEYVGATASAGLVAAVAVAVPGKVVPGVLVVGVEAASLSFQSRRVAGATSTAVVEGVCVGVAAAARAGFPGNLAAIELRVGRLAVIVGVISRAVEGRDSGNANVDF